MEKKFEDLTILCESVGLLQGEQGKKNLILLQNLREKHQRYTVREAAVADLSEIADAIKILTAVDAFKREETRQKNFDILMNNTYRINFSNLVIKLHKLKLFEEDNFHKNLDVIVQKEKERFQLFSNHENSKTAAHVYATAQANNSLESLFNSCLFCLTWKAVFAKKESAQNNFDLIIKQEYALMRPVLLALAELSRINNLCDKYRDFIDAFPNKKNISSVGLGIYRLAENGQDTKDNISFITQYEGQHAEYLSSGLTKLTKENMATEENRTFIAQDKGQYANGRAKGLITLHQATIDTPENRTFIMESREKHDNLLAEALSLLQNMDTKENRLFIQHSPKDSVELLRTLKKCRLHTRENWTSIRNAGPEYLADLNIILNLLHEKNFFSVKPQEIFEQVNNYLQQAKKRHHGIHFLNTMLCTLKEKEDTIKNSIPFNRIFFNLLTRDIDVDAEPIELDHILALFHDSNNIHRDRGSEIRDHLNIVLNLMNRMNSNEDIRFSLCLFCEMRIFYEYVSDIVSNAHQQIEKSQRSDTRQAKKSIKDTLENRARDIIENVQNKPEPEDEEEATIVLALPIAILANLSTFIKDHPALQKKHLTGMVLHLLHAIICKSKENFSVGNDILYFLYDFSAYAPDICLPIISKLYEQRVLNLNDQRTTLEEWRKKRQEGTFSLSEAGLISHYSSIYEKSLQHAKPTSNELMTEENLTGLAML